MVEKDEVSKDFRKQVLGYGLTTAEIVYRRPDRHWLLQTYVWQDYDLQLPLPTPSSSSQPNCTPSTACSGCTDSTRAITAERCFHNLRPQTSRAAAAARATRAAAVLGFA